jgi:hypothetical protein
MGGVGRVMAFHLYNTSPYSPVGRGLDSRGDAEAQRKQKILSFGLKKVLKKVQKPCCSQRLCASAGEKNILFV